MTFDPGRSSFRDPFGRLFLSGGELHRSIFQPGIESYRAVRGAGLYEELIGDGLLQPHEEVPAPAEAPGGSIVCLRHSRLPFVCYPWEWPFSALKDAALLELEILERLLDRGFWLRDASAFNVQFEGSRPVFIDTLSIGLRPPRAPWPAYAQFCSHFLAPLAIASAIDPRLLGLWRSHLDGVPLDLAVRMLPRRSRYRPGLLVHLTLHARLQAAADRERDLQRRPSRPVSISDAGLAGLVRSLRRTVERLRPPSQSSFWADYGSFCGYTSSQTDDKRRFVSEALERSRPSLVWDLGANTGEYSLLAAQAGAFVVSIDSDPGCAERLYRRQRGAESGARILPLVMDLSNPTPSVGWGHAERFSLAERGPADLALALAVIHHLVLACNVPLERVAEWLSRIAREVVVEFVPPEDPMAARLIANRRGEHLPYALDAFRAAFGGTFRSERELLLENGRRLFHLISARTV